MISDDFKKMIEITPLRRMVVSRDNIPKEGFFVGGRPTHWDRARRDLEALGGKVLGYYDAFGLVAEESHNGLLVLTEADLQREQHQHVLFAGNPRKSWFGFARAGMQSCTWHKPIKEPRKTGWFQPELLEKHSKKLQRVYELLADDASRKIFSSIVRARIEGDTGYIEISRYPEYLHPACIPMLGETVIDIGGYDGDTARVFSPLVGPNGKVICLEPSFNNYLKLSEFSAQVDTRNVLPLCLAAWNESTLLRFNSSSASGGSNRLSDDGVERVVATTIDRLTHDLSLTRLDVLKLDVEGAEAAVIDGAKDAIYRFRPILLVSLYHHANDLFELPNFLFGSLENYQFFLGHHSYYHCETDLYAVPVERIEPSFLKNLGIK
jgi:FkbM family methyltransferase